MVGFTIEIYLVSVQLHHNLMLISQQQNLSASTLISAPSTYCLLPIAAELPDRRL